MAANVGSDDGTPGSISWESAFDAAADLISIHSRSFRIVRINDSFARAFGVDKERAVGRKCYEVVHGTKRPPLDCPHCRVIKERRPVSEEIWKKNQSGLNLFISVSPIFADSGPPVGTIHIAREINVDGCRKTDQQELAELTKGLTSRQREVLELLSDGRTVKEIGMLLHLSPSTIEFHKRQMMGFMGARTVPELIKLVILPDFHSGNQQH